MSLADGRQLDVSIPFTDRYRWSEEADGLFLWALLSEEVVSTEVENGWVVRYAFDPARGTLGAEEIVISWEEAGRAETLGVATDGSALAVSSIARSRSQIVGVDHLRGLQTDRIP